MAGSARRDEAMVMVKVTANAPWLPTGGRAEAFRGRTAPRPMSIVRLLLRRDDEVFCVPRRETGSLDLPMRITAESDPDGAETVSRLADDVIGARCDLTFVGAVRNTVDPDAARAADYGWPTPEAYFGVWTTASSPTVDGVWVTIAGGASSLREKHWYPIIFGERGPISVEESREEGSAESGRAG